MIDISDKKEVAREALASGFIHLSEESLKAITEGTVKKGDVLATAKVSGVMAAKHTPDIIPFCHPIPLQKIDVSFTIHKGGIEAKCLVKASYRTGVEMETLACVSSALLTIWDMTKYIEKDETGNYPDTKITDIQVIRKVKNATLT
ncbi:MAG: cyclic pyranopterin monophosphate synthase MoaC [Candidatus Thermoplasmatota archaeon]|nr:cyclic pyranopterin monophosphate synthase MoaC [Candidatus Thermoplasmatota archaeon]